jgi:hypothetical protein
MAGIGLLIVIQSLGTLARVNLTWDSMPQLFDRDAILHWTPGVAFALDMHVRGDESFAPISCPPNRDRPCDQVAFWRVWLSRHAIWPVATRNGCLPTP